MLNSREVKDYLSHHHLPQLLESMLTGLLYHHPEDPISYLHNCLITTRKLGGPKAVTWDTFIHLERHQPSQRPPRPTCAPQRPPSVPKRISSVLPGTSFVPSKTACPPSTAPKIFQSTTQISPVTPSVTPKSSKPNKTHSLIQTSALKPQTVPPLLQMTTPLITPPSSWIIPPITPTATGAPPPYSSLQTPSMKPKLSVLPPLTPQLSSISDKMLLGPPQTASEQNPKPLPPPLLQPAIALPPILSEWNEDQDKTSATKEGPPPSPIGSQLSIDSDSDMTESSGLQQEVSIKPPQRTHPIIVFVIGGPGSGKGSQASRLAESFNLRVISLDELLRRQLLYQASPSKRWEVISQMMSHGELGLQEETILQLRQQLTGQQEVKGFIVDGFPRDVHQALSFQEQFGSPDLVIFLSCTSETLCCRLQRRASELGLLGDSSHALHKRLSTFQREIISVRRYYKQLNLLRQVDADRDKDRVFTDLKSVIKERLPRKESSDLADIPECGDARPSGTI